MAHLKTQATTQDLPGRLRWKLALIKRLYQTGYQRNDITLITDLIDRMMSLPPKLDLEYKAELNRFEAEQSMGYTYQGSIARLQRVEFAREYIVRILTARFGTVPAEVAEALNALWDEDLMGELLEQAATTHSIKEFQQFLIDRLSALN
ncbi:hypothetical protein LEP3755_41910 [Leptolyngbya sp. NIES-3755]|nr:hypothetical protein LEP3755_41910 [Leptolyngbya sp. NIES-3755]